MCTTVVSIDPYSPVPVLMVGVRDEFLDRPWLPPAHHWPEYPELVGGQDLRAAGTWLAVHPAVPRVACVLNGHGEPAPDSARLTRGTLPLRLAADGELGEFDPSRYDPFHLLCAMPEATRMWSWNGRTLTERTLGAGVHVIVNSGLEGADDHDGPGVEQMRARIEFFKPLFEKATRPEPWPQLATHIADTTDITGPTDTDTDTTDAVWGEWLALAGGAGVDPSDPRALVLRRFVDDRSWGTSSLSLVALTRTAARYDFCADPAADHPAWSRIL